MTHQDLYLITLRIARRNPEWAANRIIIGEEDTKRLLVLATKHCPQDHHDFEEIKRIASRWEKNNDD